MRSVGSPDSSSGSAPPQHQHQHRGSAAQELPPGFRFHPTDEELVVHYLKKKAAKVPFPIVTIIAEVDLYKFDPWELPEKATFGEKEWYFFSPRDRKYPNGARPNRAATSGYWKATGTDKPIMASGGGREKVGVKKALVFYRGKPPKGLKTNWIMHEFRLTDSPPNSTTATTTSRPPAVTAGIRAASLRLDDWVLCRIYKKINKAAAAGGQQRSVECEEDAVAAAYPPYATADGAGPGGAHGGNYTSLLNHHDRHEDNFLDDGLLTAEHAGLSAGATSLSQLAAGPSSFNWLDASTVAALLPHTKNLPGFNRGRNAVNMPLSSTADQTTTAGRMADSTAGTCTVDGGNGAAAATPGFMNLLPVHGATTSTMTYHPQHSMVGTSSTPPEEDDTCAFQISAGVNWNNPS